MRDSMDLGVHLYGMVRSVSCLKVLCGVGC